MIMDSKGISYDLIDITEPGKEDEKTYMQNNSKSKDGSKNALPPQIFNGDVYCGVSGFLSSTRHYVSVVLKQHFKAINYFKYFMNVCFES